MPLSILFVRQFLICLLFFTFECSASLAQDTLYLTWQKNPSSTMTIQWITDSRDRTSCLSYRLKSEKNKWIPISGKIFPFPFATQYIIHQVELQGLNPSTEYSFKIDPDDREYSFLTAPSELTKELHFVVGGDMFHDAIQWMENTCKQAALTSPLFALIGGDIAYAVPSRFFNTQKIDHWIQWIQTWHRTMVTPQGHLIPVIAAVGNHDVIGEYDQTPSQAAIFSALFPMPGSQIYNVMDFDSYLSIFILDTGHANPIAGQQTQWLRMALSQRKHTLHRLALYHIPAYPSVRKFNNRHSNAIRRFWVPEFEKGGIQTAFEHHDHAYKRSYPLLKNRIHPKGILYLGDGGWGVEFPRHTRRKMYYIAKSAPIRHFISVSITPQEQHFKCIDDRGQLIDHYSHSIAHSKYQN